MTKRLYRSREGQVLCLGHLPRLDSTQWIADGWQTIAASRDGCGCDRCATQTTRGVPLQAPLILNVDDRPSALYLRDRVLRERGFVVINADSGHAAMAAAHRIRPALILLDVHLGDADGRELCEQVKEDAGLSGVSVVLISATLRGQVARSEAVRDHHADAFLIEPVEPELLAHTIRKVLGITA